MSKDRRRIWVSCNVRTDSHLVSEASFRRFQSNAANVRIHCVDDRHIRIHVASPDLSASEDEQIHHAHQVTKAVVLALNVGSLGHFYWENEPWVHPTLIVSDDLQGKNTRAVALMVNSPNTEYCERRLFSEADEYRTVLLFGVFARGSANVLEDEYCRALLLLRMNFCEINFLRDAFMCFYRTLEYFATGRILKVPRLRNELKGLQSCIRTLEFSDDLVQEMKELYIIRSSQAAHSQTERRQITLDEVLKIKIFVDALLFKPLYDEANDIMTKQVGRPLGIPE